MKNIHCLTNLCSQTVHCLRGVWCLLQRRTLQTLSHPSCCSACLPSADASGADATSTVQVHQREENAQSNKMSETDFPPSWPSSSMSAVRRFSMTSAACSLTPKRPSHDGLPFVATGNNVKGSAYSNIMLKKNNRTQNIIALKTINGITNHEKRASKTPQRQKNQVTKHRTSSVINTSYIPFSILASNIRAITANSNANTRTSSIFY